MRNVLILLFMLLGTATSAIAQVSVAIGLPGMSIGFNQPYYPQLVRVPGYPVYYAPGLNSNFFFYDGMYWIYERDNWYASSWYNGPWGFVDPGMVPLYVLRVPVRYYRDPPMYFRGWRTDAPPRWGDHWGHGWEQQRSGWDRWNRKSAPAPAPLPAYQRKYSGDRYPQADQQRDLHNRNYRYQPRDTEVRQHNEEANRQQREPTSSPSRQRVPESPRENDFRPQDRPHSSSSQSGRDVMQRPAPTRVVPQQREPVTHDQDRPSGQEARHLQQTPGPSQDSAQRGRDATQEPGRGERQDNQRESGEGRGQGRNR